jgi:hypothetical protein
MDMAEARAALGATMSALRAIYGELRSIEQSVPPSPRETSEEDWQDDLGGHDELRAVLGTVLHDCFTPMLDDLETLTQAPPAASAPSAPELRLAEPVVCRKLDLAAEEGEMLPVVHALVVKDNFTARPSDEEPGEVWLPRYTPEEAGLRVWKTYGRWFAAWRKLEVPENAPEDERWEFLLVEEDPRLRGCLVYREIQTGS